jgi:hypothetical protein
MGRRIFAVTKDPRETCFLFQRLSVAVQCFSAVCFANSFGHVHDELRKPAEAHPELFVTFLLISHAFGNEVPSAVKKIYNNNIKKHSQ